MPYYLKLPLLVFVLLSPLHVISQQYFTITGLVTDGSKIGCSVTLNDTVQRFMAKRPKTDIVNREYLEASRKLISDTTVRVFTKEDGRFTIRARRGDTLFFSGNHTINQKYAVSDLLKRRRIEIHLEKEPCVEFVTCNEKLPRKFYAFIAEKISITNIKQPYYCGDIIPFNEALLCKYLVVKNIYGNYARDTVVFESYYHEGPPSFPQFKNILVFVSEYCGKLYQEKYQFFDVFQTADGRWASPGDPYKFDKYIKEKTVQAIPLKFDPALCFDTKWKFLIPEIKYSEPYFRIENGKAYPLLGAYVEDLFQIKRGGVLTGRKIFPRGD